MRRFLLTLGAILLLGTFSTPTTAQSRSVSADVSPVLLLESRPSDRPDYRRMINVKYLAGNSVRVNYTAYNRAEFKQSPNRAPQEAIQNCSQGKATSLSDIRKFEREEAKRAKRGEVPSVAYFCIKNISGWKGGNRDKYLDPIFNGMPHAATLK